MKTLQLQSRTLKLLAVIVPLLVLFIYVALRSGPLAPVAVTVVTVESRAIMPALFGIGTIEARYTYKIGPTFAGRIKTLDVHVGDVVKAGQVLGEMDPIDLDERVRAQNAAYKRSEAAVREAEARHSYAKAQARRYEQLFAARATSEEIVTTKRQDLKVTDAALSAAREELARMRADREGLILQRSSLRLVAPVNGVIVVRDADPGTTIVAGQAVVEIVDPTSLWVNVRFDQMNASGLAAKLSAYIVLRSHSERGFPGSVMRVEPKADSVTEETLAKIIFDVIPQPPPPIGELAEVTVNLPPRSASPSIPNAAVRRDADRVGVWQIVDGDLHFTRVKLGAVDLEGFVQVLEGLKVGDQIVAYSEKVLTANSRIDIVDHISGVSQ